MTFWICDVNGVLVDSTDLVRQAFAATARRYRVPFDEHDFKAIRTLGLLDAYRLLDRGCDPYPRRAFHLRYVRERVGEVRACPGVVETLAAARALGVRVGAATSYGEIAEAALVTTGVYSLIDCLVTQEEVQRQKPHPESILRVLALLRADRHEPDLDAVHVGDTAADIEAGKAAGIRTVGVTYGVSSEAEMRAAAPDDIIDSFDAMRAWCPDATGAGALPLAGTGEWQRVSPEEVGR